MKVLLFRIAGLFTVLVMHLTLNAQGNTREFYQLKTYIFDSEAQEQTTDNYLKNAYLPALQKMGVSDIGVFKLRPAYNLATNRTYVLIPFKDLEQFQSVEEKLRADENFLNDGKDYLQADHEHPPYKRVSSVLLKAFKDMPKMKIPELKGDKEKRVYELRSYEGPNETYYQKKVAMFNEGGEIMLFEQLGFNAVFYAEVLSGDQMPNLMYMTTFTDMESRDAHWKAFSDSPKWKEISVLPKYQNTVSHADIILLYPTEYSDY